MAIRMLSPLAQFPAPRGGEHIRRAEPLEILAENLFPGQSLNPYVTQQRIVLANRFK